MQNKKLFVFLGHCFASIASAFVGPIFDFSNYFSYVVDLLLVLVIFVKKGNELFLSILITRTLIIAIYIRVQLLCALIVVKVIKGGLG